jgi:hypothetical protein
MFRDTSISGALPSGMTLASLTIGSYMFSYTSISGALPSGMTLASLTLGTTMFYNTSISGALPSGMTLVSLTNGSYMFYNTSVSGALPSGMTLASLTNGSYMFAGTLIDAVFYSYLLKAMEANNSNSSVAFHGGPAKYWSGDAATARAALIADHSWTFTDGGADTTVDWTSSDYEITDDFAVNNDTVWPKSSGTITLAPPVSTTKTYDFNGEQIEDLVIDGAGTAELTGTFVTDSLTCTSGTLDVNAQNITVVGNMTVAAGCSVIE